MEIDRGNVFLVLQGLTVRLEHGKVIVARILIDSVIDRQGLVQTGDTILQCNGKDVKNPEELQKAIESAPASEFIVFKIRPAVPDTADDEVASTVKPEKSGKGKVRCHDTRYLSSYPSSPEWICRSPIFHPSTSLRKKNLLHKSAV